MKNKIGLAFGITLMLLLTTASWARQASTNQVTGRITSVDSVANTFTVETPSGTVIFKTTAQTMFMLRDENTHLTDMMSGDQVRITFTGDGENRTATRVDGVNPDTQPQGSGATYGSTGTVASMGMGKTVTGRVTAVDVSGKSMTIDTGMGSQTFQVGSNCRIQTRNGSSNFVDIKVNDQVRVEPMMNGSTAASRVEFMPSGMAPEMHASVQPGELPRTGSPLPLIGLMGALMIGAGLVLRAYRKSTV